MTLDEVRGRVLRYYGLSKSALDQMTSQPPSLFNPRSEDVERRRNDDRAAVYQAIRAHESYNPRNPNPEPPMENPVGQP